MINPNKVNKLSNVGSVVHIDAHGSYIPYIQVLMPSGQLIEGSLTKCNTQWAKIKVGDSVGVSVQYSIMAQKYMINSLTRKRN